MALLLSDQLVSGDEAQFVASFASPRGAEAVLNLPACWNILRGLKQNALESPLSQITPNRWGAKLPRRFYLQPGLRSTGLEVMTFIE